MKNSLYILFLLSYCFSYQIKIISDDHLASSKYFNYNNDITGIMKIHKKTQDRIGKIFVLKTIIVEIQSNP